MEMEGSQKENSPPGTETEIVEVDREANCGSHGRVNVTREGGTQECPNGRVQRRWEVKAIANSS